MSFCLFLGHLCSNLGSQYKEGPLCAVVETTRGTNVATTSNEVWARMREPEETHDGNRVMTDDGQSLGGGGGKWETSHNSFYCNKQQDEPVAITALVSTVLKGIDGMRGWIMSSYGIHLLAKPRVLYALSLKMRRAAEAYSWNP